MTTETKRDEYFQGNRIERTGKTEHLYGSEWYEAVFIEGHRKGEKVLRPVEMLQSQFPCFYK